MARRTTLTHEALATLGPEKLARLVLDETERNAPFRKLVAAALAGTKGPGAVAALVDRRLSALERARGFIDWDKCKVFAADLRATLVTITDELGPADPKAGVDRLLRFLTCAPGVFERVDDSSGHVQDLFHVAADALPALATRMEEGDRGRLLERLVSLLDADGYGLIETVVHGTIPLLAASGLAEIDARLATLTETDGPRQGGRARDWERLARGDRLVRIRQAIADRSGDVDGFVALESRRPDGRRDTLAVAERLLAAGRADEALDWVRRPGRPGLRAMTIADVADGAPATDLSDRGRVALEVRILMALGRKEAAQDLRWRTFEATLDAEILRAYVAHLPDFEEFDVLEHAFAHVRADPHRYRALAFLLAWPRLDLAADLVVAHREVWAGGHYGALVPAAEALEHDHPVAATILYRALLDDILARARSPAYGHGARYLARLTALAPAGLGASGIAEHDAYFAGLRTAHGRKAAFWSVVDRTR